jgi:hypothetical protein
MVANRTRLVDVADEVGGRQEAQRRQRDHGHAGGVGAKIATAPKPQADRTHRAVPRRCGDGDTVTFA